MYIIILECANQVTRARIPSKTINNKSGETLLLFFNSSLLYFTTQNQFFYHGINFTSCSKRMKRLSLLWCFSDLTLVKVTCWAKIGQKHKIKTAAQLIIGFKLFFLLSDQNSQILGLKIKVFLGVGLWNIGSTKIKY